MPNPNRRLILANGEKYAVFVDKKGGGGSKEPPRSYDVARDRVKNDIATSLGTLAGLPQHKRLKDEAVLCLRLHPDRTAKSFDPEAVFSLVPELERVGSRNYRVPANEIAQTKSIKKQLEKQIFEATGRLVFVRSNDAGFKRLLRALDKAERDLPKKFLEEIQSIERFDLLRADEQIDGFDDSWKEGRVEIVLHPSNHSEGEQQHFLDTLFRESGADSGHLSVKIYDDGPLFVCCRLSRQSLMALAGSNPLRTAHPLVFGGFESLRSGLNLQSPPPSTSTTRSTIKVGMFDGGINTLHPLLVGHAEQDEALSIKTPPFDQGVAHGTAVAGAMLYGPLNAHDQNTPLPPPPVSVVSVRALPTADITDINLYESIDIIEAAVPARKDVKIWNISFGPRGPIVDDMISRFTYALDRLATEHKVLFCSAVGNDGEAGPDLSRIQSPSDMVNGLGIGAFTKQDDKVIHAPYSCRGPGRECGKLKPDVVAFGGCPHRPFHLLGVPSRSVAMSAGTSFAAPLVASLAGQATESFERGSALLARALIVHTSGNSDCDPDHFLGHGPIASDLDAVLRCDEKSVTVIFQGAIPAKKYVKLPLMLPAGIVTSGKVLLSWTVASLSPVEPNHPADYTSMAIEDAFYPHSQQFYFTSNAKGSKSKSRRLHVVDDAVEISSLKKAGWKQASMPQTGSGNQYPTEQERRDGYKWETIVRKHASKVATSLHEPFIVLHALPRHGANRALEYAAVVTIRAPKFEGDLYDAVIRRFTALQPVRLRTEVELRVAI